MKLGNFQFSISKTWSIGVSRSC